MVRAGNLITNNLSNAYAAGAVSLPGETRVEPAYASTRACVCVCTRVYALYSVKRTTKYRKAITTFV
jgi:hypothetical protein